MRINLFLIFLFIGLSWPVFAAGQKYGLFVGISNYPRDSDKLDSSVNDATEICRIFSAQCGTGNSKLLLNGAATRSGILNGIKNVHKAAAKGDLFVFYFSGHGTLFPDKFSALQDETILLNPDSGNSSGDMLKGKYDSALIPFDATGNDENKPWKNLILDDELFQLFSEMTGKGIKVVVISDSCYAGGQDKGDFNLSNKFLKELGKDKFLDWKDAIGIKAESEINKGSVNQKTSQPIPDINDNYILVASSKINESSFSKSPGSKMDLSNFTYHFLLIYNQYRESKKTFTFETIKNEVAPLVASYAQKYKKSQNPLVNSKYFKGSLNIPVF